MNEELKVIISAEVAKFKQGIDDAKKQIKTFNEQVKEAGKEVPAKFKEIGTSIKDNLKVAAVSIAALGAALLSTVGATEEYRQNMALLTTSFETAGGSAETAKQTFNDLYRVLGDGGQATEAAQHLAKLTTDEKHLAEWTNICQGVYATFGASLPIESLTEAANETAKTGQLTGALADALNWAGVNEDLFQEQLAACNTEAEREALIRTTLNGLYSEASASYETNNAQVLAQRDAQASLQEKLAALGETLAPIITAFTTFANDVLAILIPYIQELATNVMPELGEVLKTAAEIIGKIIGFVVDNWEIILAIAGVIGGISAAIGIYNTVAAVKAAMNAAEVTTVWALVQAYLAKAAAMGAAIAPYLLIVAAITAVIAIIVVCIKHWDDIKKAAANAWEWIKNAWKNAGEWFGKIVDKIKAVFANIGEWFKNLFANAWKGIQNAWSGVKNWFSDIWKGIENTFKNVGNWFSNIFTNAWNGIKNAFSSTGSFFTGIWNGIKNAFGSVADWFKNIFSKAWQAVKDVFSTGGKIFDGIKDGIVSTFKTVVNAIIGGLNKVIAIPFNSINGILNFIRNISFLGISPFKGLWKQNPLPVPQIPMLAEGGIVDSATLAMIGENGKEAVVPLENNLEWLDKLATMLGNKMGGGSKQIVLNVDGKTFAQTTIESINELTNQTGTLGLVIA